MLPPSCLFIPPDAKQLYISPIHAGAKQFYISSTRWVPPTMHWPSFNRRYLFAKHSESDAPGCSLPSCNVSAGCCQQRRKSACRCTGLADFKWDTLTSCGCVLAAEVLGTVMLIILCVVAANTATQMNSDIDAAALTSLAFSDPLALCVNATDNVQGMVLKQTLSLQADRFEDKEGQVWRKVPEYDNPSGLTESSGIFSFASPLNENMERVSFIHSDVSFDQTDTRYNPTASGNFIRTTIAAMYYCGLITGGYNAEDLPSFTISQCGQCDRPQSSNVPEVLKDEKVDMRVSAAVQQLGGAERSTGSDINQARAKPDITPVAANYTLILQPTVPGNSAPPAPRNATDASVWTYQNLLPALDFVGPAWQGLFNDRNFTDTAIYLTMPAWAWGLNDSSLNDLETGISWAPPLTLRVSVYGKDLDMFDDQVQPIKYLSGSAWFQLKKQSNETAKCMAESATMAAHALSSMNWTLKAPNGTTITIRPADHNLTANRLYFSIPFERLSDDAQPYTCVGGVEVSGPDSAVYLSKQTAYRANAKSQHRTSMFVSMQNQTYDDVYAVYTGALGAMALLVATLFVYVQYALVLVYHTSIGCN